MSPVGDSASESLLDQTDGSAPILTELEADECYQ